MKKILSLYKILTKNAEMRLPNAGTKGRMYMMLGIVAVSCIMIPCCLIVGFVSYIMTEALTAVNAPANGILAEIHIMSAFSLVFGMLVIFNLMFFSSDREHLVPLPFKSYEIMLAKFMFSYLAESVMEFLILISMFIGFFISYGVTPVGIITAIIGVAVIPLVPMAYCVIIALILLVLLKNVKNGKIFNYISTIMMFAFIGLFLYSFKDMGGITVDNYVDMLAGNTNLFSNILDVVFFPVPVFVSALTSGSIFKLVIYIVLNVLVIAVMGVFGALTYQQGLYTVGALGSGRKKASLITKNTKKRSVFAAYTIKELKVLLRTKAYSGNCVFINYLWPACIAGYIILNYKKEGYISLLQSFALGKDRAFVLLTISIVMLSFITSAMNSLASTAYTREGQHLDIVKYIPVPYDLQVIVKGFISMAIPFPALLITDIIVVLAMKISPLWILCHLVLIVLCLFITTVIGLYLDSAHPHSLWDDEYSALRGNLNSFFDMALVIVVSAIICGIGFMINALLGVGVMGFHIYMSVILTLLAAVMYWFGYPGIVKNMEDMSKG